MFVAISIIIIIIFSFSPGCDRYVENDYECCNRTITNVMENVADLLQFRLAVSPIGNEYLCCKQDSSIPPITQLKDPASSKSVHRLGNRWDTKRLFVMTFIIISYSALYRLKRKRETKLTRSSP